MKRLFAILICVVLSLCVLASCGTNKTYIIVTDDKMLPFCYVDGSGNPLGFDIDILNAIAENQNLKIEIQPVGLLDGFEALDKGNADGMIAALIPSDDLMAKYDFSDMYYNYEYAFAVAKGKNSALMEKFNTGLANIIADGTYDKIYSQHFEYKELN